MKTLLGLVLTMGGIAVGLYVGVWLMLVGGIMQFVDGVTADPVSSKDIAIGVVRVMFSSLAGWLSFFVVASAGFTILTKGFIRTARGALK